jgi:hypothetical protein
MTVGRLIWLYIEMLAIGHSHERFLFGLTNESKIIVYMYFLSGYTFSCSVVPPNCTVPIFLVLISFFWYVFFLVHQ